MGRVIDRETAMFPENDTRVWYHLILTTYGSWLYGDKRGFRTRHHRQHVDGDYKNPPPTEKHEATRRQSTQSLKQSPVKLSFENREKVGIALKERLEELGAFVLTMAVAAQHAHIQAKTENGEARRWAGLAKVHSWFVLREDGWQGKLWGKRSKAIRIHDQQQQNNVHRYILKHAEEGAWVWKWTDAIGSDA